MNCSNPCTGNLTIVDKSSARTAGLSGTNLRADQNSGSALLGVAGFGQSFHVSQAFANWVKIDISGTVATGACK